MKNQVYLEALIYGSYGLTLFSVYVLIGLVFYINKSTEIRILQQASNPKKFRDRNKVNASIELALQQRKLALLWPIFLIKGLKKDAQKKE